MEIENYSWPIGKDGRELKEEPIKIDDHGCDAMRYAVMYVDKGSSKYTVTRVGVGGTKPREAVNELNDPRW